jgi:hypothetical protein
VTRIVRYAERDDTPFRNRAGEIHGFININKTCTEAYTTPVFRDFGKWFEALLNIPATKLTKNLYSFEFGGYPSVEYVQYNDTTMELDVVIVQGFHVFEAFHEVFAFEKRVGGSECWIHRTQYIILADKGPVTWNDMKVAGTEELTGMYKLLGP